MNLSPTERGQDRLTASHLSQDVPVLESLKPRDRSAGRSSEGNRATSNEWEAPSQTAITEREESPVSVGTGVNGKE